MEKLEFSVVVEFISYIDIILPIMLCFIDIFVDEKLQ